jgi:hypothetical protein
VAALLELGRLFGTAPRTARSIVFMATTAEERGLLGSEYYASHPIYPLATTVADINMDILGVYGPTHDVSTFGEAQNTLLAELTQLARAQGRTYTPDPSPEAGHFFRSDHFSLAKRGVPAMSFSPGDNLVNGGVAAGRAHREDYYAHRYHQPGDEWTPNMDFRGEAQDVSLLYSLGKELATSGWPEWSSGSEFKAIRDQSASQRHRRPLLSTTFDLAFQPFDERFADRSGGALVGLQQQIFSKWNARVSHFHQAPRLELRLDEGGRTECDALATQGCGQCQRIVCEIEVLRLLESVQPGGGEPTSPGLSVVVMKQPMPQDRFVAIPLRRAAPAAGDNRYAFHGKQPVMSQTGWSGTDIDVTDCYVRFAPQDSQLERSFELELDVGVRGRKPLQARNEPASGERRLTGDPQALRSKSPHRLHGTLNLQKPRRQFGCEMLPRGSELHRPVQAPKQLTSNILLETANVSAYRRLRDVQLASCFREAQSSGGYFEGAQREQGGEARCRHRIECEQPHWPLLA